jgi:hypothetical protein
MGLKVSGFKRFMNTYEEVFYLVFYSFSKKLPPQYFDQKYQILRVQFVEQFVEQPVQQICPTACWTSIFKS